MIIHFSILAVILIRYNNLHSIRCFGERKYKSPLLPWLFVFGYITFLAGMRSGMNDTSVYINSFEKTTGTWGEILNIIVSEGKDKGFSVVSNLFKMFISTDFHMWFLFLASIESIFFIYILRREAVSFSEACFFFFCSTLYYNYFSMTRQWFAVVVLFVGGKFIKENRTISYILLCIFAAQFHSSAYLFIPIYFCVRGQAWNRKQNILIGLFSIGIIFLEPILSSMENTLGGTTYDYVIATMATNSGASGIRILIACVPIIIAFYYRKDIKDKMINICVNMSVLNFLLNVLAVFTSGLYVVRLATYTNVFNIILYPYLLNVSIKGRNRTIIKCGFYIFYFLFFIYQMNHQESWGYKSDVLGTFSY